MNWVRCTNINQKVTDDQSNMSNFFENVLSCSHQQQEKQKVLKQQLLPPSLPTYRPPSLHLSIYLLPPSASDAWISTVRHISEPVCRYKERQAAGGTEQQSVGGETFIGPRTEQSKENWQYPAPKATPVIQSNMVRSLLIIRNGESYPGKVWYSVKKKKFPWMIYLLLVKCPLNCLQEKSLQDKIWVFHPPQKTPVAWILNEKCCSLF